MKTRKAEMHEELQAAVDEPTIPVTYSVRFREYHLIRLDPGDSLTQWGYGKGIDEDELSGPELRYCPWSGETLPGSLRDEWFDIVWDELGLKDFDIFSSVKGLPEEMVTEEWWIRREIGPTNDVLDPGYEKLEHVDYIIPEPDTERPPGFRRPSGCLPHSCEAMAASFEDRDPDILIAYLPWTREYGIRILDPDQPVDHQPLEIKPIRYCPWCGDELPESLREEWQRRLAAMGLTPESDDIPERLMSDAWWREAGL